MDVVERSNRLYEPLHAAESIPPSAELKLNAAGVILDWSTAAGALLRLTAEQVLEHSLFDLLAPQDPFQRMELLQAFKYATDRAPHGVRLIWRNAHDTLKIELHAVRDRSGKLLHVSLLLTPDNSGPAC